MTQKFTAFFPSLFFLISACDGAVTLPKGTEKGATSEESDAGSVPDTAAESDGGIVGEMDSGPDTSLLPNWCTNQQSNFSFFVTSMDGLWNLSGSTAGDLLGGFGGNFGGIAGADNICQTIAAATGHGDKTWRAFLSATNDGNGNAVHAIDRIGAGPWYDANGRLVATGIPGLLSEPRPDGEPQSTSDLPDECGVPLSVLGDAHDVVTGSGSDGRLAVNDLAATCNDWTADSGAVGATNNGGGLGDVQCGHSFPRSNNSGLSWLSDHGLRGCDKGANLIQNGAGEGTCIGCSGGYGALYCFAQQ